MENNNLRAFLPVLLAVALLAGGAAYLIEGARKAWTANNDRDMQLRHEEYGLFLDRVYPHARVAADKGVANVKLHSVYPPYAYPLFSVVFWPPNYAGARVVFEVLTLAALVMMMVDGARRLGFAGPRFALLGAVIPVAFSGNSSAVGLGQFSIACAAAVVLQMNFLAGNKPAAAGICWALSMMKPQIGLPFVCLFAVGRNWRGLAAGVAFLTLLTALALLWTGVSPWDFCQHGLSNQKLRWLTGEPHLMGAGLWINAIGLNPRFGTMLGVGAVVALFVAFWRFGTQISAETAAAFCAAAGMTLFYHRPYDNIMLYPLVIALAAAITHKSNSLLFLALSVVCLLNFLPAGAIYRAAAQNPIFCWLNFLAPAAAAFPLALVPPGKLPAAAQINRLRHEP